MSALGCFLSNECFLNLAKHRGDEPVRVPALPANANSRVAMHRRPPPVAEVLSLLQTHVTSDDGYAVSGPASATRVGPCRAFQRKYPVTMVTGMERGRFPLRWR